MTGPAEAFSSEFAPVGLVSKRNDHGGCTVGDTYEAGDPGMVVRGHDQEGEMGEEERERWEIRSTVGGHREEETRVVKRTDASVVGWGPVPKQPISQPPGDTAHS